MFLLPPLETAVPARADGNLTVSADGEVATGKALVLPGLKAAVVRGRASTERWPAGTPSQHDLRGRRSGDRTRPSLTPDIPASLMQDAAHRHGRAGAGRGHERAIWTFLW